MPEPSRRFEVTLDWRGAEGTVLSSSRSTGTIAGAGVLAAEERGWKPEELLLGALGLCLTRTFESLANREGLHVERCHTRVEATLSPTPYGANVKLGFTLLTAHLDVAVPPDEAGRARDLAIQAKQYCIVANALMPPLHLELAVESVERALSGAAKG
jgi:organic hydroperoxide reductase OsmC/OhrA